MVMSAGRDSAVAPAPSRIPPTVSGAMPEIELRLSPLYALGLIVFGAMMFFVGLLFLSTQSRGRNVGLGIFICAASAATMIGSNYWRHHLPVMVRMTSRQLLIPGQWPRRVVVDWNNIADIQKKSLAISRYGVRNQSEFVLIKLKKPLEVDDPLSQAFPAYKRFNQAFVKGISHAILGGYDLVINPLDFFRTADWFIAECKKRMTDASAIRLSSGVSPL